MAASDAPSGVGKVLRLATMFSSSAMPAAALSSSGTTVGCRE
jgi:hypothetical protein